MNTARKLLTVLGSGAAAAAFAPTDLTGLEFWAKFDDASNVWQDSARTTPVASDGDPIGAVDDLSGNSRHFLQATASKQPVWKTGIINGKAVGQSDGTADLLVHATAFLSTASGTVFAIFENVATLQTGFVLTSGDEAVTTNWLGVYAAITTLSDSVGIRDNDDFVYGSSAVVAGTPNYVIYSSSGTAYSMRVDGSNETVSVNAGTDSGDWFGDRADLDNVALFALKRTTEGNWAKLNLLEVGVYSSQITGADLTSLESYLATRSGV